MSTGKVRINVNALIDDGVVGKFLVVCPPEAGLDDFLTRVRRALNRSGIHGTVVNVLNSNRANLPPDEQVGDMIRSDEEVYVLLRGTDGVRMDQPHELMEPEDPGFNDTGATRATAAYLSPQKKPPLPHCYCFGRIEID